MKPLPPSSRPQRGTLGLLLSALVLLSGLYGILTIYSVSETAQQTISGAEDEADKLAKLIAMILIPHSDIICGSLRNAFLRQGYWSSSDETLGGMSITIFELRNATWLNAGTTDSTGRFCVKLAQIYAVNELVVLIRGNGYPTYYIRPYEVSQTYYLIADLSVGQTYYFVADQELGKP